MGHKSWVINASPLILLGKVGHLDLLANLSEAILIPSAVIKEIDAKNEGKTIINVIEQHKQFHIPEDIDIPTELLIWDLGAGESQTIALGLRHHCERVVLDDMRARRCAKAMSLTVIGTLGLIARAKHLGHIEKAEPIIRQLCQTGLYTSEDLISWILREIDEV